LVEAFGQMSLGRGGKYKKQRKTRKNKNIKQENLYMVKDVKQNIKNIVKL